MIAAILWKEWREHWPAFSFLIALSVGIVVLINFNSIQSESGSVFEGFQIFLKVLTIVISLILVNLIVSREYRSGTHHFLVTLPLSRFLLVLVKYLLGLGLLQATVFIGFLITLYWAADSEILSWRYILILLSRSVTFSILVFSFLFFVSTLGRYQFAFCIGLAIFIASIDEATEFSFEESSFYVLLDETFPYESEHFPVKALTESLTVSILFVFVAFGLALYKDGDIPDAFSQKMSGREKVYLTGFIGLGAFGFGYLDYSLPKDPYTLHDAIEVNKEGFAVNFLPPIESVREDSEGLTTRTANELDEVAKYLGFEDMPDVFITNRGDLGGDQYEVGNLEETEGLHVRVNSSAEDWSEEKFFRWLIREALITRAKGRVELERKMWVLDGFPYYWSTRGSPGSLMEADQIFLLRALYGADPIPSRENLAHWLTYRERYGHEIAPAVAWSLLRVLAAKEGGDRCRAFVRSVLGVEVKNLFISFLKDAFRPPDSLLLSEAGISLDDLLIEWEKTLEALRAVDQERLTAIPTLRGTIEFAEISPKTRKVRYTLLVEPSPAEETRCSFLYCRLPPFDIEVPPYRIKREDSSYPNGKALELFETFSVGDRLYWTLAYRCEPLDCEIITGWERATVE